MLSWDSSYRSQSIAGRHAGLPRECVILRRFNPSFDLRIGVRLRHPFIRRAFFSQRTIPCTTHTLNRERCIMVEQRFTLEWDRPVLPHASTHVSLFHGGKDPQHIVASGHGRDDAKALADLLATLEDRHESAESISYVSEAIRSSRSLRPTG
jgi:hypothetical protein